MIQFSEYIQKIIKAKTLSEFPVKKDFDYTVAFIMPELGSTEGIYRTLLPSMHLTESSTIRCLPVGLSQQKFMTSQNEKDFQIRQSLAEISNHIVFPFVSYSLEDIIAELKAINHSLRFSYYIDFNYYFTPAGYPFGNEYEGAGAIANIEKNITLVDQIIVTNHELYKFLHIELSKKEIIKGCGTDIVYQPLYFDKDMIQGLQDVVPTKKKIKRKTRFGFVLNKYHFSDVVFIKGILKEFQKKHKDDIEIVVLGWNGEYEGRPNYFSGLDIEYHEPVIFFDYFEKLNSLAIDCFVIPAKNNKFNDTSKNYIKLIEFTRLGKPVICPDLTPYRELITHNDSGVLCGAKDTWLMEMETFLTDRQKYEGIKDRTFNAIVDKEIYDLDNLKILMETYEI